MRKAKDKNQDDNFNQINQIVKYREFKIVKSNDFIQKSRFSLTVQEQKIILYLISKIRPEDMELKQHAFEIKDFCIICGLDALNGANYKYIKQTLKNLRDKSMWLTLENGSEILLAWLDYIIINKDSGSVNIKINDVMKPYLLQLQERFTQYELFYTLAMKSQYSIRLYELLKSYENLYIKSFEINNFKKLLMCENYRNFNDFQRFVLSIAIREINKFSDLSITYTTIKEGKRFAQIEFTIQLKKAPGEKDSSWSQIQLDEFIPVAEKN